MLKKPLSNFYSYSLESDEKNKLIAHLEINPEHEIFTGHFPDNPVTPGVTQVEIVRQILCDVFKKDLIFSAAKDIKYFIPLVPPFPKHLQIEINYKKEENTLQTNCSFVAEEQVFTKIRGTFSRYE